MNSEEGTAEEAEVQSGLLEKIQSVADLRSDLMETSVQDAFHFHQTFGLCCRLKKLKFSTWLKT